MENKNDRISKRLEESLMTAERARQAYQEFIDRILGQDQAHVGFINDLQFPKK